MDSRGDLDDKWPELSDGKQTATGTKAGESLAQHLPVELLSLIFNSTLPSFPTANPVAAVSPIFALAGVCSLWRNVALSTPELWASIQVALPIDLSADDGMVAIMWRVVKLCVDWSRGRPLTLTLDERLPSSTVISGLFQAGVTLDRVVEITACAHTMNLILSKSLIGGTMELSTLRRMFVISSPPSNGSGENVKGCQLPMLEHFEMDLQFSEDYPLLTTLPWNLITDLDITITHDQFVSKFIRWWILTQAPKLRNLRICAPFSYPAAAFLADPFDSRELPSLKSLSILAPHSTTWSILRRLELPLS